jgi:hypothetical protein
MQAATIITPQTALRESDPAPIAWTTPAIQQPYDSRCTERQAR